jgi:hypothetical protein
MKLVKLQAFKNRSNNSKPIQTFRLIFGIFESLPLFISNQTSSNLINLLILMCYFLWWGSFWANVNWISFTNSVPVYYSFLKWLIYYSFTKVCNYINSFHTFGHHNVRLVVFWLFTSLLCPTSVRKQCWVSRSHIFTNMSFELQQDNKIMWRKHIIWFITYRAKLLDADWLMKEGFFL